ncbi:MAG: KH domain-containing protein [Chloroflexota bacterium]
MKDLIEYIACSLVDDPKQVSVNAYKRGSITNYKLHVAKEDMGRVIGRSGRVANAMRMLVNVAAAREGQQVTLDVEDPE